MSSYDYWTESFVADDVSQQERDNADEDLEQRWDREDRLRRDDPCKHPMDKTPSQEQRREALEPRYAAAVAKFYGKDAA